MQLSKAQAEEIVRRDIEFVKDMIDAIDGEEGDIETGTLKDVYRDLGVLGLALKFQLDKDESYQQAFKTLSEENVRLHMTVTTLAEQVGDISDHLEGVSGQLRRYEEAFEEVEHKARVSEEARDTIIDMIHQEEFALSTEVLHD